MVEKTLDEFIKRIKDIVLTDEKMTVIPLAYMMTLDMPDSIKHFFDQEVEIWIREEEKKFTSTEQFDYDMPEVRMLIDQVFDKLKQNAAFNITKFNQLLERAIKLEMNFLIEPHRTLTQFLFKDSPKISTMEIYDTLKYFFRYEYYKNAISDYFNLKYLKEISEDQFVDLINQIDEKVFSENPAETILKTLKTIMTFLGEAQGTEVNSIPVDVLYSAFRDRNLTDFVKLMDSLSDKTELSELTFEDIEVMLRDGIIPGVEVEEAKEPTEVIGFEAHEDIEESKPEIAVDEIEVQEAEADIVELEEEVEEEEYEEELEEEYEEGVIEEAAEAEAVTEEVAPGPLVDVAQDLADHVARQISSDTPLEDLDNLIKGRMRRKLVKRLFGKSEDEFLNIIRNLNGLATWKDASSLIDDEFYNRGINPYSKEATSFSDIVYVRFFPKDKYVGEKEESEKF